MPIHSLAVVHPSAQIADDVSIGPFSVIGAKVKIGAGTTIANNVSI
jgi:acyl-[acyl carrier protein]--UDP-N-acetylglucosamine O-acyltransferase